MGIEERSSNKIYYIRTGGIKQALRGKKDISRKRSPGQIRVATDIHKQGRVVFAPKISQRNFPKAGPVRVRFEEQILSHLNDARGIDNAARKALDIALESDEPKETTCFLSPGTPVMAYTWGMVCRTNPQLNLRVIASSEPRKPPEEIELPKDAILPFAFRPSQNPTTEFDVVFLSLVRTPLNYKSQNPSQNPFGFPRLYNRLNVSMSRQKKLLVVVGDKDYYNTEIAKEKVPGLADFLKFCQEKGRVL